MNNLRIFNFDISDIKIGTEKVKAVMLGGRKHWPSVDEKQYFTLKAVTDSVIKFSKTGLNFSLDEGKTWTPLAANAPIAVEKGKKIMFQGTPTGSSGEPYGIGSFSASTGSFEAEGNIMSLTYGTDFIGKTSLAGRGNFCLSCIFKGCTSLVSAKNLLLPATTLTQQCYYATFSGCTNMVEGPTILPAETLSSLCYQEMFRGCTKLEKSPILPAETLVDRCYHYMFNGCTSLNDITCYATNSTNSSAYTDNWVTNVAPTGVFHKNEEKKTNWARSVYNIPPTWQVEGVEDYFKVVAEEDCVIKIDRSGHYGSRDGGLTWFSMGTSGTPLAAGEELLMSGVLSTSSSAPYGVGGFSGSTGGKFHVEGNIMTLRFGDNYTYEKDSDFLPSTFGSYLFCRMFQGTKVTSIKDLVLPNTASNYMFDNTFLNCTELVEVMEELPAMELADYCYNGMFNGCTKLEKPPVLPAKTLKPSSYINMFYGCTSLNEIWCYATDITASNCVANWVTNVAPTGIFHRDSGNTQWAINNVSGVPIGWELDPPLGYFTLVANAPSVVAFSKSGLSGSTDSGATWFAMGTSSVPLNTGDELWLKGKMSPVTDSSPYGIGNFSASTGDFSAKGSPLSLLYGDDMSGAMKAYGLSELFQDCTAITSAEELMLTSPTADNCYRAMFRRATNLKTAPELPGTILATNCYSYLFNGCTSLVKAPKLPATTVVTNAYRFMYSGCTSLNEIWCDATNIDASTSYTNTWVADVAPTGVFHKNMDEKTTLVRGINGIPETWQVAGVSGYLAIVAETDCNIKNTTNGLYGSKDNGVTWFAMGTSGTPVTAGEKLLMNSTITPMTSSPYGIGQLSGSTGYFSVEGNAQSVNYGDNFIGQTVVKQRAISNMFRNCTGLTSIENLELTSTTLNNSCYANTFEGCTNLVTVPEDLLPAMSVPTEGYYGLFQGCTSLVKPPKLPATTLNGTCYKYLFSGCTSLNEIWCDAVNVTTANTENWVANVAPTGTFHKNQELTTNWVHNNTSGIPVGWILDPIPDYFTVVAEESCVIKINRSGHSGSTDGGLTWFAMGTSGTPLEAGEELMMKSTLSPNTGTTPYGVGCFASSTGKFHIKGNIMSLRYGENLNTQKSTGESDFRCLFQGCTGLTSAEEMYIPSDVSVGSNVFCRAFQDCTSLVKAPKELMSKTLAQYAYEYMFLGCTALTEAPILGSATSFGTNCYHATFSGCSSLSKIVSYVTSNVSGYSADFSTGVAPTGTFVKNLEKPTYWVRGNAGIPIGWEVEGLDNYFTIVAEEQSTINSSKGNWYYSIDNEPWALLTANTNVTLEEGQEMRLHSSGNIAGATSDARGNGCFSASTGSFTAKGDIKSLCLGDNYDLQPVLYQDSFTNLFKGCTAITSVEKVDFPTTLKNDDFPWAFSGCTRLSKVAVLPALTMGSKSSYWEMFANCTALEEVPKDMLPALGLGTNSYYSMFKGCTSLVKAPVLPATTMAETCYSYMFSGCTSLNEIWCYATGNTTAHTNTWVAGVAEYGTFHKNEDSPTNWSRGTSSIPVKWGASDPEKYLTIEAIEASTVKFTNSICRSLDNGESWETLAANTATELAPGEKALYGGILGANTSSEPYGVGTFSASTGNFKAYGPVLAMTWMDNSEQAIRSDHNFSSMFRNCPAITDAEGIILPQVLNKNHVCYAMFAGCPNLKKVPKLTSDITKGGQTQYQRMFMNSTGLEEVPADMLPAETLTAQCYYGMFSGCTSLVKAPLLPAKVLPSECYFGMFSGCTSLNEIWCSATSYGSNCCSAWTVNVAENGTFHKNLEEQTEWSRGNSGIPAAWTVDGLNNYFTIKAVEDSVVRFSWQNGNTYYSLDDGNTWIRYSSNNLAVPLSAGEKMLFQGRYDTSTGTSWTFSGTTGNIEIEGNIMSVVRGDNYDIATRHQDGAYTNLFNGCTALTSCENLDFTDTPMGYRSCNIMFPRCTNLTKIPRQLPAMTLAQQCYCSMFSGCTSLETVSEDLLPATTMATLCYQEMFRECSALVKAPKLPAKTAVDRCYHIMFYHCSSLNEIWCDATNISNNSSTYTNQWVEGVAPVGVFHKNMEETTSWGRGVHSIPGTWSVDGVSNYLTIEAIEPSVIKHTNSWYRSTDSGVTWQEIAANVATNLEAGETVMYNANKTPVTGDPYTGIGSFSASTGVYKVYGNPKSMLYGDNFSDKTPNKYRSYQKLFLKCTGLTDCSGLILPEYLENNDVYAEMFNECTNLVSVPEYVGKDSTTESRYRMFYGCTSLVKPPKLPAETLANADYYEMFSGCTSLNEIWCDAVNISASNCTNNWVNGVSPTGVFHKNMSQKTNWTRGNSGIPATWGVAENDNYFKIEAEEASTIKFSKGGLYYSVDSGETWSAYTANSAIELAAGEQVWFNGVKTPDSSEPRGIGNFSASTGVFNAKGDAMSLLYGDNIDYQTTSKSYAFQLLFMNCTGLTDASDLILTAETLSSTDFYAMFSGCTSLVLPPKELPAKVISTYGYSHMFMGCTSLTKAPYIAATGYSGSFNCSHMFSGCTSLTEVQDELHPLTISANMYDSMFLGCSSLEKAPYLPATVASVNNCYGWMFQDCTSLKYIKCGAVTLGGQNNWVSGVPEGGVFYKAPAASWSTGASGIPSGWEVKLMSEDVG